METDHLTDEELIALIRETRLAKDIALKRVFDNPPLVEGGLPPNEEELMGRANELMLLTTSLETDMNERVTSSCAY